MSILKPSSDIDDNDIMIELTAGVGGQEAMLFAADMFDMYQRYAAFRGWTFNVLEYFTTDMGESILVVTLGLFRLVLKIYMYAMYANLKIELYDTFV